MQIGLGLSIPQIAMRSGASAEPDPNLANWFAALAAVQAGSADATVLCIGDSTTAGLGSNGAASAGGAANSIPAQLAALLTGRGINASATSFMGPRVSTDVAEVEAFDPMINLSGAWGFGGSGALGGAAMFNAEGAGTLTYSPGKVTSALDIYYPTLAGLAGTITVNINGGATLATVNMQQDAAFRKQTIAATPGTNVWNLVRATSSAYFTGLVARGAAKEVSLINCGWAGSTTDSWNYSDGFPWNPLSAVRAVAPKLSIIGGPGINDAANAVDPETTYRTNLGNLYDACLESGDVLVWTQIPPQGLDLAPYVAVMKSLAAAKGITVVDTFTSFGSWAAANAAGKMFDQYHPTGLGYADITAQIAATLDP